MTSRETRGEDDGSRARPRRGLHTRGRRDESRSVIGSWCVAARAIGNRRETAALPALTDALVARFANERHEAPHRHRDRRRGGDRRARGRRAPPLRPARGDRGDRIPRDLHRRPRRVDRLGERQVHGCAPTPLTRDRRAPLASDAARGAPRGRDPTRGPRDRAISARATRSRAVFFPTSRSGRPAASEKRLAPGFRRASRARLPRLPATPPSPPLPIDPPSERGRPLRTPPLTAQASPT